MKIFLTDLNGKRHVLDAPEGWRLMEVIRDYGFSMKAECGGACACATCHVYIDQSWLGKIPTPRADEEAKLDEAIAPKENSRLSCQIILDETMDGLEVYLAPNPD